MIIATWNVERLKHIRELDEIIKICVNTHADILILTETDERIVLPYKNFWFTEPLDHEILPYKATERRVAIYSNYECIGFHSTYDPCTALCVELEAEYGKMLVYGTIIGIQGNRDKSYLPDLMKQTADYRRLNKEGILCVAGDFNCSFSDNYYFTEVGRENLLSCFAENGLELLTASKKECVDHIVLSGGLVHACSLWEWNEEKTLSDHKGITVELK